MKPDVYAIRDIERQLSVIKLQVQDCWSLPPEETAGPYLLRRPLETATPYLLRRLQHLLLKTVVPYLAPEDTDASYFLRETARSIVIGLGPKTKEHKNADSFGSSMQEVDVTTLLHHSVSQVTAILVSTPEETVATCPDHIVGAKRDYLSARLFCSLARILFKHPNSFGPCTSSCPASLVLTYCQKVGTRLLVTNQGLRLEFCFISSRIEGFDRRAYKTRFRTEVKMAPRGFPSEVHEERLHRRFTRSASIGCSRGAPPSEVHEELLHWRFTRSSSIGGSRGAPPSEVARVSNVSSVDLGLHLEIFY
ncbi:hypothetical protein Tco_0833929 [Tanacetum coccineum]